MNQNLEASSTEHDRFDDRVLALLRSSLRSVARTGRTTVRASVEATDDGFERVARSFQRRLVDKVMASPRPVAHPDALLAALSEHTSTVAMSSATAGLVARKLFKRAGPLKIIAKRAPWLMAAGALPAAYTSLAHGAEEVSLVSSYLIERSRRAGMVPDPDRLRRVTVQLLLRDPVDAETEPEHHELVVSWLWRAAKAVLPFTKAGRTPHAKSVVSAAERVDVSRLQAGLKPSTS